MYFIILFLGGLQGFIGWWMVKSGLVNDPSVSQYRLTIHLSNALLILSLLIWVYLEIKEGVSQIKPDFSFFMFSILFITIIAGAFVAGMDAGLMYNEYPLMGDGLIPENYGEYKLLDPFENPASAQFHHRHLALFTTLCALCYCYNNYFKNDDHTFEPEPPSAEYLHNGLGKRILHLITSSKMIEPWFLFLHIHDLHWQLVVPENFSGSKFGNMDYDKIISSIDPWIGKFIESMNLDRTLVTITADHGQLIPFDEKGVENFEPELKTILKTGKKIMPKFSQNLGAKAIGTIKRSIRDTRLKNANRNLSSYEIRSRLPYYTLSLFDESIMTPLLFSGFGIKKHTEKMDSRAEALLMVASRAQLTKTLIKPLINKGTCVVADRYMDSTIAYQGGGRELDIEYLLGLNEFATYSTKPDITFLIDIDPVECANRTEPKELDRIESAGVNFQKKVRKQYLDLAERYPERVFKINGSKSIDYIHKEIWNKTWTFLNEKN